MKIISNFKDFYDYLQGVYGIDEKIVYERLCEEAKIRPKEKVWNKIPLHRPEHVLFPNMEPEKLLKYVLSICGLKYIVFVYKGEYYFGQEGGNMLFKEIYHKLDDNQRQLLYGYGDKKMRPYFYWNRNIDEHLQPTNINNEYNCPVIIKNLDSIVKNVRLSDYGINKIVSAESMYLMISQFLTRETPVVDNRTNLEKIVGAGFDKITSFRNM